jgi:hypothetical protein
MTIHFWSNDPTILFNKDYIFELWPSSSMCYEQKLNAISRLIILLTILGYILTMSMKILAVGALTLLVIFILYGTRRQKLTKDMLENFDSSPSVQGNEVTGMFDNKPKSFVNPVTLDAVLRTEFKEGTKKNPFSNVLLTQINDDPERKAAPPSFNVDVDEDITKSSSKDTYQYIVDEILKTSYSVFKNTVLLSPADVDFIFKLEKGEKRKFTERIFNVLVF